jgi:sugar O-acyltransferase (sialic acid O-acetyltransferase NeuD family)
MRLHVAGTGSFAAEVVEFARAAGIRVDGLIELIDRSRVGTSIHGLPVIDAESLPEPEARAVVGLGGERTALWGRLREHGWEAATVVHPRAAISPSARVGAGCIVGPLVVVGARSILGDHGLLGRGALIGHHVVLGEGVVVNPGANVAGNVHIGRGASIGMGATIVNGLKIGEGAVVAAGAVVIRDVPAATRVQGVPAQIYSGSSGNP